MTKMRDKTVLPQMLGRNRDGKEINGEVLYPFGPPVYRTEIDDNILQMLIDEGKRIRKEKPKDNDHRNHLAGVMGSTEQSTSVKYDKGEVRNRADMAIVQKVFEFFDILSGNYGDGWQNINKTLSPDNKPNVLRLDQLWINFQHKYDFNPPHDHSGVFSFVMFGDIDEKIFTENVPPTNANVSGKLCFQYGEKISGLQANNFTVEPYRGLMYVFPATLQHYVAPFYTDYERISISGNYVLQNPGQNIQPMSEEQVKKLNLT